MPPSYITVQEKREKWLRGWECVAGEETWREVEPCIGKKEALQVLNCLTMEGMPIGKWDELLR